MMKTNSLPIAPETMPREVRVRQVKKSEWDAMIDLVQDLMVEISTSSSSNHPPLDTELLKFNLSRNRVKHFAFFALDERERVLGLATVEECFALYANGFLGVVHEIYIPPQFRGIGIGRKLLEHVKTFGMLRNWSQLDATAPNTSNWLETANFYQRQGFVMAGQKLRFDY